MRPSGGVWRSIGLECDHNMLEWVGHTWHRIAAFGRAAATAAWAE
jgi:hypothetical protein